MMFSKVIALLVIVGSSVFIGFSIGRRSASQADADPAGLRDVDYLARTLELTPEQRERIGGLHAALADKAMACCDACCVAKASILDRLHEGESGAQAAREAVETMCRRQAESEVATFECLYAVREVLSPEQRVRYDALLSRALSCTCPSGHACQQKSSCAAGEGETSCGHEDRDGREGLERQKGP